MKIPLCIMVMGTRGKSSLIAVVTDYLEKNGYKVLSRQTGLIPAMTYGDSHYFLRRNKFDMGFDRPIETKIVLEHFQGKLEIDCLVIENNAISEYHMSKLSQYVKPDITIITTISPDHILDQGTDPEKTSKIFLNSVYSKTQIIFYSNHAIEVEQMHKTAKKLKLSFPIIEVPLSLRNKAVIECMSKILKKKDIQLKPYTKIYDLAHRTDTTLIKNEMLAELDDSKLLINLGSINDLLHTQIFIDEVQDKMDGPYYLMLNFREDREDRTWIFMNYILPKISGSFDGVIIRSDSPVFTENYIKRFVAKKFQTIVCIPTSSFSDFKDRVVNLLPAKSKIIILANTANDFGFELIEHYKFFQESYPVLKKVHIADLN